MVAFKDYYMAQGEGGGRPQIELTPAQAKEVETLAAVLNQQQIAAYFGFSEKTLRTIMERDEQVFTAYHRGRAKAIASIAKSVIVEAQSGNMVAAKLYLSTQAGWTEKTQIDNISSDGSMSPPNRIEIVPGDDSTY